MFANIADFKHLTQELDPLPVEALLVVVVVHGLLIHSVPLILNIVQYRVFGNNHFEWYSSSSLLNTW